jgi:tetratricopeptide (TPR) repeat protein
LDAQTQWAVGQIQRYSREGNAAAVVEIGEHVLAHDEGDLKTFLLAACCLASAYERLEQWDSSLRWLGQCLLIEPVNPTLLAARGRVLMKMGKTAEAAAVLCDLARRYPDQADYHGASGSVLLRLADLQGALHHLRRARELDPTDPYILNDLASAYLLEGDLEASLSAFKQATDHISPDDLELARDIRQSIEEVRAALILRQRGVDPPTAARIADVHSDYVSTSSMAAEPESGETKHDDPTTVFCNSKVRPVVLDAMTRQGCRPRQVLAALHLWSDYLETLPAEEQARTERKTPSWAAAVIYTIGRLDGAAWGIQREVAKSFGVSPATLSRCFGRLRRALTIEVGDPRYSTVPNRRRTALIEQIHLGQLTPERLLLR